MCWPSVRQNFHGHESYADVQVLADALSKQAGLEGFPLVVLCDDPQFLAATLNNFLWVRFTRANPSHDLHGVDSFIEKQTLGLS